MGSPRDQAVLGNILLKAGAAAIFPLLRAGLRIVREFNPLRTKGVIPNDHQAAELVWIYKIAEPMLESIGVLVKMIGQPAYDELCRALWELNEHFKLLACLVLFQELHPSRRTLRGIRDWWVVNVGVDLSTLDHLSVQVLYTTLNVQRQSDSDKPYFRDGGAVMMLNTLLARGGDPRFQQLQGDFYRDAGISVAEGDERTRNTGLLFLARRELSYD
jgi:hypothetical protein